MADVKLSNGKEITIDLYKISIKEYRSLFDREQPPETEDKLVAKVCDMNLDEYQNLPQPDWRLLVTTFFRKAREPLADPNSVSAST